MTVVFSDPPTPNRWISKYDDIYEACKQRPLEWAEFPGKVTTGRYRYGFRFTKRKLGEQSKVWVRYDPELDLTLRSDSSPGGMPLSTVASPSRPPHFMRLSSSDPQTTSVKLAS